MLIPKTDLEGSASNSNLDYQLLEIDQSNEIADFVIRNCK